MEFSVSDFIQNLDTSYSSFAFPTYTSKPQKDFVNPGLGSSVQMYANICPLNNAHLQHTIKKRINDVDYSDFDDSFQLGAGTSPISEKLSSDIQESFLHPQAIQSETINFTDDVKEKKTAKHSLPNTEDGKEKTKKTKTVNSLKHKFQFL